MARRFRFRLETVQRLRQRAQDEQRRVVAEHVRKVTGMQERIAGFERQIDTIAGGTRSAQRSPKLDVALLRSHHAHRGWVGYKLGEMHDGLRRAQADLAVEQANLAEAVKRLKVIEKLRERQWARHQLELSREERADADEAAVQMYVRRRSAQLSEVPA